MVKASGQIEQDLALLQKKTEQMAEALEPLYQGYLKALSESGKRQLVLAAYHLCTQAYPDRFLALSWDQRHQLQKDLQTIAAQIYEQLMQQRERSKAISRRAQNKDGLAFLQRLLEARAASSRTAKAKSSRTARGDNAEPLTQVGNQALADKTLNNDDFEDDALEDDINELDDFEAINDESNGLESRQSKLLHRTDDLNDDLDDDLNDELDNDLGDDLDDDELADDDDDIDFEMDVPAADQRLTLDEEEDLLAALESLARRSIQINEPGHLSGHLSGPFNGSIGNLPHSDLQSNETGSEAGNETGNEQEQPLVPVHLVKQQMLLEKSIRDVFKTVSEEANELLQKANVMPSFPRALMAAAADPRGMGEPINAVPNVVRMSVRVMHGEALLDADDLDADDLDADDLDSDNRENDSGLDESEARSDQERMSRQFNRRSERNFERKGGRRQRSHSRQSHRESHRESRRIAPPEMIAIEALPELAAISLRLSEVEFTDPTVSAWRGKLRQKLSELKTLGMRYKKTQRSLETAKAEDAWRASWTIQPNEADE